MKEFKMRIPANKAGTYRTVMSAAERPSYFCTRVYVRRQVSMASSLFSASALRWSGIGAGVESKRESARGRYHGAQFPSRSRARTRESREKEIDKCNVFFSEFYFGVFILIKLKFLFLSSPQFFIRSSYCYNGRWT